MIERSEAGGGAPRGIERSETGGGDPDGSAGGAGGGAPGPPPPTPPPPPHPPPPHPPPPPPPPPGIDRRLAALSDRALWLAIGAALFALSAWPLLVVELPPLKDLPNHVASAYIAHHPELYPDYVFNGLWKANSALELWLDRFADPHLLSAARTFVAVAIAANAFGLPWFVLRVAGRRAMVTASLLVWPLVHGFFVAMGMCNFVLAVPLSLVVLVLLGRQRTAPSAARAVAIVALSVAVWFAHPFPLIVVGGLCLIEVVARRVPGWRAVATLAPLAPIAALIAGTALHHLIKADGAPVGASRGLEFLTPWELPLHFWLDASGAFTRWGAVTVIPAIALPILAWRRRREPAPLTGWATAAVIVAYLGLPLMISNWWYLNSRMVPFVWIALAVRVPPALPRALVSLLVAGALAFSAALGVDYLRLDRDRAELTAGIDAVPARATLLPLLFQHRKTSEFTASLTHAWAYYVLAKQTSAPLVFAIERSYPITYRRFPPPALIPPALDRFAELHATPARLCDGERPAATRLADCAAIWQLIWSRFWAEAEPRFSHVLTWAMPPEARAMMPASYRVVFAAGELAIWARGGSAVSETQAPLSHAAR
jgi:hypothetical protein